MSKNITKILDAEKINENSELSIMGRVEKVRKHKKSIFLDIEDDTGKFQLVVDKNYFDEQPLKLGQIIKAEGIRKNTMIGEPSIFVNQYTSLVIPHTYNNKNKDNILLKIESRSKLEQELDKIFTSKGLTKVSTPILNKYSSTSSIIPLETNHYKKGKHFLKYTMELELKKLLIQTQKPIYEIGKLFKNVGESGRGTMEFTSCEAYMPYVSFDEGLEFIEQIFYQTANKFEHETSKIIRVNMKNFRNYSTSIKNIYDELKRSEDPLLIMYPPKNLSSPLYDLDEDNHVLEAKLVYKKLGTIMQICQESTDYNKIEKEFNEQKLFLEKKGRCVSIDVDFLNLLKEGAPPSIGLHIGFDRLLMAYLNKDNIRDVQF